MDKQKDTVAALNAKYWQAREKREIYQDVLAGTMKLREKRKVYLPQFPAETEADYKFRADTATCFNLTAKTRNIMTGLVFKDAVNLEEDVNPEIVDLWENIDNAGTHGDVFCRKVFESSFEGCAIILVDAPMATVGSREEQIALGLRPYWIHYTADNIWNWRWEINPISKRKQLSLLVLREITTEAKGDFTSEEVVRFRVFRFDGFMVSWQLYREEESKDKRSAEYVLEAEGLLPQLSQIPAAIVGKMGSDPVLMDIALKTLEHFQTYSDYKSLIHKTCVPIPVGKGVELGGDSQVIVGGSTMIQTSPTGGFDFAEVSGSALNVVRQSLQDNRDDIALMGLALLADKTAKVDLTATEALLNNIGETAELRVMARNMEDAIELALGFTAEYLNLGTDAGGSVTLGAAWSNQEDKYEMELNELNLRADIANKLTGIMSQKWVLNFLGVTNEEQMDEIIRQIAEQDAVILEEQEQAMERQQMMMQQFGQAAMQPQTPEQPIEEQEQQ